MTGTAGRDEPRRLTQSEDPSDGVVTESGATVDGGGPPAEEPGFWQFCRSRKAVVVLLLVTLLAGALRYRSYRRQRHIPSDTKGFLEVVSMLRGELGLRDVVPQRVGNPLYSILIYLMQKVEPDRLRACRTVAVVASTLAVPVFCLIAWAMVRRLLPGLLAGLLGATSIALVRLGSVPLAGSLFILCSAVALLACLLFVARPSLRLALATGAFGGLSWATWGPGSFGLIALGAPMALALRGEWRGRRAIGLLAAFGAAFVVCGRGPTLALRPYTRGLKPGIPYTKACIVEGAMYARGIGFRNDNVYDLNKECTNYRMYDEYRKYSLLTLLNRYGKKPYRAFLVNIGQSVTDTLPKTLAPIFALCFPLAFGLLAFRRSQSGPRQLAVLLFLVPFLVLIPAVQLHDRYIYPVALALLPLTAVGLGWMLQERPAFDLLGRGFSRILACLVLLVALPYGAYKAYHVPKEKEWSPGYREVCDWILEKHGPEFDFNVMLRYHGAYVWLGRNCVSLPRNDVDELARYCRHTHTRYIIFSPMEEEQNEHLIPAFHHGTEFVAANTKFTIVKISGQGPTKVLLIEVTPVGDLPPLP